MTTNKILSTEKRQQLLKRLYHCTLKKDKKQKFLDEMALKDLDNTEALKQYFSQYQANRMIGIMGGHKIARGTALYRQTALLGKQLREANYVVITGGGPGVMEAAHLGAWFAGRTDDELYHAIDTLKQVVDFNSPDYAKLAADIKKEYPHKLEGTSVAVPTFIYSHREPINLFAAFYAIYFNGALREQALLRSSTGAVVFMPGGTGTSLEILTSLEQDKTFKDIFDERTLILFSTKFWHNRISEVFKKKAYMANTVEETLEYINQHLKPERDAINKN